MAVPKWTEERTQSLTDFVGGESPVSQATVASAAEHLETSPRSVSSKLRKMGFDVELASSVSTRTFSEQEENTLNAFVTDNSGNYTYAEIASAFEGGKYSAKSIQGKILSMELTDHVKPTEKPASVRTYNPDEEATFLQLVSEGARPPWVHQRTPTSLPRRLEVLQDPEEGQALGQLHPQRGWKPDGAGSAKSGASAGPRSPPPGSSKLPARQGRRLLSDPHGLASGGLSPGRLDYVRGSDG